VIHPLRYSAARTVGKFHTSSNGSNAAFSSGHGLPTNSFDGFLEPRSLLQQRRQCVGRLYSFRPTSRHKALISLTMRRYPAVAMILQ
jgi:hypothetical protein